MAQTLKQEQETKQDDLEQQQQQEAGTPDNNDDNQKSQNRATRPLVGRSQLSRISPNQQLQQQQQSVDLVDCASSSANLALLNRRYQPSKIFISKCRAELEALLTAIKDKYHEEIKELYNEQNHADLFIQFGEQEFKKPLHRCVVASRAYKLYNTIKAFQLVEVPVEEDIIISEFQEKINLETNSENLEKRKLSTDGGEAADGVDTNSTDQSEISNIPDQSESKKEEKEEEQTDPDVKEEEEPILHCNLPEDLIGPDLLLNFVRRVYLDTDVSEEEIKLNLRLIDWLKQNKPELIRVKQTTTPIPNHRESFRTILPDFEDLPIVSKPPTSTTTTTTMSPEQLINLNDDGDSNLDDQDETSQSMSMRDVSLTGSLLTRTETFEFLNKNSNADCSFVTTPSKNILVDDSEDNKSDSGNTSNTQSSYAPVTRTGLKPKTFTTPVGMRATNTKPATSTSKSQSTTPKGGTAAAAAAASKTTGRTNLSKQTSTGTQGTTPVAASKRSSLSSNVSESTAEAQKSPAVNKTGKLATTTTKVKPTMITRALPISMERSQSPSTTVIKGSTRNFIAANKRLVGQMEKRPVSINNDSSSLVVDDPSSAGLEANDGSLFILDSLTMENMVAQMDKFTLVSHSKLAEALSSMFINSILTDTIILVKEPEKQIKAHKCILATRSAYLAEMLAKQCLPSTDSVPSNGLQPLKIDLTEFSYSAVYFSMLHIYSGIVKVPEDLDIDELTKLTHHLHVTTLTQVCLQNLRMNYCHFFHKPCNVCCIGVLKTLPLAWRYDYTELYSKCLQWIGSHFASVFCLKEFSELKPHDLLEECYSATLSQLTPENIIPKTIECQKLLSNLPRVKWTESIICLVGRQLEDFCNYVAENYEKILQSESFMNLSKNCWECEVLEENLLAAMNHLKPDSGCKTLIQLHKIECSMETYCDDARNVSDSFANLISKMRKYCERYLLKEATAVVHCSSWRHMSPSLQKRIKDQAIISTDFDEPTKQLTSKPKLPSMLRHQTSSSPGGGGGAADAARSPSNRSTPDSKLKSPSTTFLPPPKNKTAAARHVKVLK